ncbi:MAG: hypothetical protein OXC54_07775 [Rhodospirillaceae bacterium]|nr:hypothetical protein [Rhodospirillaceae bacterium]MCY4238907.1 hypothetical protein [Rhodospirillaceae bacterium]MCY4311191.1 hypothetical protein [Rhodospirillaceae bacterium]
MAAVSDGLGRTPSTAAEASWKINSLASKLTTSRNRNVTELRSGRPVFRLSGQWVLSDVQVVEPDDGGTGRKIGRVVTIAKREDTGVASIPPARRSPKLM